jgi:3-hydroxyacyl-CoA dehydrogenase
MTIPAVSYLNAQLNSSSGVPEVITKLTTDGKLGMKSGYGMYAYGEGEVTAERAVIVQGLVAARRALSATRPV